MISCQYDKINVKWKGGIDSEMLTIWSSQAR